MGDHALRKNSIELGQNKDSPSEQMFVIIDLLMCRSMAECRIISVNICDPVPFAPGSIFAIWFSAVLHYICLLAHL